MRVEAVRFTGKGGVEVIAMAELEQRRRRAARDHVAGELEAGHVGRGPGRRRIEAAALQQVGAVDPGGDDLDLDLALTGLADVAPTRCPTTAGCSTSPTSAPASTW